MTKPAKDKPNVPLVVVGLLAWLIPGAGHFVIKERKRAGIIFFAITLTFAAGLYAGSIRVINRKQARLAYAAQIMNSPAVSLLEKIAAEQDYHVFAKPNEMGQIYTSIAGLLNLLCIVNAVYLAHMKKTERIRE